MNELTEFDKAFLLAYKHVNECPDYVALSFVNAKTDKQQDDFYKSHSDYYSHLMDTYSTFSAGFEYAQKLHGVAP
tara:strand:+ start:333 stop:557 length:225 start_codon:yes stop_codon:yes gene_type:complete